MNATVAAAFLTRLRLEEYVLRGQSVPGEWVMFQVLIYRAACGVLYSVPRGFITDLASIPAWARSILLVNDKHRRAAVLHDYLYVVQSVPRSVADALFLEAMKVVGVPAAKRYLMWAAVRAGGWAYWNKRKGSALEGDFVPEAYFDDVLTA